MRSALGRTWTRLAIAAACVLAVGLRLAWVEESRAIPAIANPVLDAEVYHAWAVDLVRGEARSEVFYMSPLYAYALAAVYDATGHVEPLEPRRLQALLAALTTLLVALSGRRLGGDVAAVVAAFAWALLGISRFFDGVLVGVSLATLLAALTGYAMLRAASPAGAALAGASLGAFCLTRPNGLALAPLLLLALLLPAEARPLGRRLRDAAIAVLAMAALVAPATLHNARAGDPVLVSSNGGVNLFLGNHRGARGTYTSTPELPDDPRRQLAAATRTAESIAGRELLPSEVSGFWTEKALAEMRLDLGRTARLIGIKALYLVNDLEPQLNFKYAFFRQQSTVLGLPAIRFGLLLPLAVLGLAVGWRERSRQLMASLTLLFLGTLLPFFISGRFRLPALVWLVPLAAAGAVELVRIVRARAWRQRKLALALAVLATLVAHIPAPEEDDAAMWNLAGTLEEEEGDLAEAEASYRKALEVRGGTHRSAALNLARLLHRQDRLDDALEVLEANRHHADAAFLLALGYARSGRADDAFDAVEEALRGGAQTPEAWMLHGNLLVGRGQAERARQSFERALQLSPGFPPALVALRNLGAADAP